MEPEEIKTSGSRKFLIITLAVILVIVGALLGYLFMQKDTPGQQIVEVDPKIVKKNEKPHLLSSEEKAIIEERMNVSNTPTITKKEVSALGQREQSTKRVLTLTEDEKAVIEERISF